MNTPYRVAPSRMVMVLDADGALVAVFCGERRDQDRAARLLVDAANQEHAEPTPRVSMRKALRQATRKEIAR